MVRKRSPDSGFDGPHVEFNSIEFSAKTHDETGWILNEDEFCLKIDRSRSWNASNFIEWILPRRHTSVLGS